MVVACKLVFCGELGVWGKYFFERLFCWPGERYTMLVDEEINSSMVVGWNCGCVGFNRWFFVVAKAFG